MAKRKLFIPLVVDYCTDDKVIAAGPMAELLFVRSLAFCKRTRSDGVIEQRQLNIIGYGMTSLAKHARSLVQEGLWAERREGGWIIPSWFKHNAPASHGEELSVAALKANHVRWKHDGPFQSCPLCSGSDSGSDDESDDFGPIDRPKTEKKTEKKTDTKTDDDKSDRGSTHATPRAPSSSSDRSADYRLAVDLIVDVAERNVMPVNASGFRVSVTKTTEAERGEEIWRQLGAGMSVQSVVESITKNSFLVRAAMGKRGLPCERRMDPILDAHMMPKAS